MSHQDDPILSEIRGNEALYRMGIIECLISCLRVALASNDAANATFTPDKKARFRDEMRFKTTAELEKKLYAIQAQNPGLLVDAMKRHGFSFSRDGGGDIKIEYAPATSGIGEYVSPEAFEGAQ